MSVTHVRTNSCLLFPLSHKINELYKKKFHTNSGNDSVKKKYQIFTFMFEKSIKRVLNCIEF
jgi:hypothetical protein